MRTWHPTWGNTVVSCRGWHCCSPYSSVGLSRCRLSMPFRRLDGVTTWRLMHGGFTALSRTGKETAAQVLARHLQKGWRRSEGTFTLRDVYRNQWAGLSTTEEAVAALQVL